MARSFPPRPSIPVVITWLGAAAAYAGTEHPQEVRVAVRIIIGLVLTVAAFAIAGRRLWWLYRVARTGQPAPERVAAVRTHPGQDVGTQATEVLGQRRLPRSAGDFPGDRHPAGLPGGADQHRGLPLPPRRFRLAARGALARPA